MKIKFFMFLFAFLLLLTVVRAQGVTGDECDDTDNSCANGYTCVGADSTTDTEGTCTADTSTSPSSDSPSSDSPTVTSDNTSVPGPTIVTPTSNSAVGTSTAPTTEAAIPSSFTYATAPSVSVVTIITSNSKALSPGYMAFIAAPVIAWVAGRN